MQPLIDLIKELIHEQLGFFDRGNVVNPDFLKTDLTLDGAWHDLDLSTIVPADAQAVLLRISMQEDLVGRIGSLRKKGHTGWPNVAECRIQVANIGIAFDKIVGLDSDRFCQYNFTAAAWTWISITVSGWWLR